MESSARIRELMEKGQLATCDIRCQEVLGAMAEVRREDFVPAAFAGAAYVDEEIPLCAGRFLIEPLAFSHMLERADISPRDNVLDVGCGLGYSSAVLSRLAHKVVALEEHSELVNEARKQLSKYKLANVEVITSPLSSGSVSHAPFDVIILEGAVQSIPGTLLEQLAEGGRLVTVENLQQRPGERTGLGRLLCITRNGQHFSHDTGRNLSIPVLPGFEKRTAFEF